MDRPVGHMHQLRQSGVNNSDTHPSVRNLPAMQSRSLARDPLGERLIQDSFELNGHPLDRLHGPQVGRGVHLSKNADIATTILSSEVMGQQTTCRYPLNNHSRQLPSVDGAISKKSHQMIATCSEPDENSIPQNWINRRSLPPMNHIYESSANTYGSKVNTKDTKLHLDDETRIYAPSFGSHWPIGTGIRPNSTQNMRQLPTITPFGPQPVNHLHGQVHSINHLRLGTHPDSLLSDHESCLRSDVFQLSNDSVKQAPPITSRRESENHHPAHSTMQQIGHFKLMPTKTQRAQVGHGPKRLLPIITKEGVLRLRDNMDPDGHAVDQTLQQNQLGLNNPILSLNYSFGDRDQDRHRLTSSNLHNVANEDDVQMLDEFEEQTSLVSESELFENNGMFSGQEMDGEFTSVPMNRDEVETFSEERVSEQDEERLDEESDFYESIQRDVEEEEEEEYFSALPTVPEEEGKLSDKETIQDCREMDSRSYDEEEEVPKGADVSNCGGKLPTIVENGFEAQVLNYIAGKTGLKLARGELFSVDEETSVYSGDEVTKVPEAFHSVESQDRSLDFAENSTSISNELTYQSDIEGVNYCGRSGQQSQLDEIPEVPQDERPSAESSDYNPNQAKQTEDEDLFSSLDQRVGNSDEQKSSEEINQVPNRFEKAQLEPTSNGPSEYSELLQNYHPNEQAGGIMMPNTIIPSGIDSTTPFYEIKNELQPYEEDAMVSYELDEVDDRILTSQEEAKNSFEQEDYDERYRDINNLEDLDRRATNHVHAIDGHSKSMLNDIHQQRTIVDYYDDGDEFPVPYEQVHELTGRADQVSDADKENMVEEEANDRVSEGFLDDFGQKLPKARVRWITAFNKIVNRAAEVSKKTLKRGWLIQCRRVVLAVFNI